MTKALACPTCARPYQADDLRPEQRVAVCRACDRVYPLAQRRRKPVAKAKDWTRAEERGGLVLHHRWIGWQVIFFLVWCTFWFVGLGAAFVNGEFPVFLILHVLAGLVVAYYTLCTLVNTSTITVRSGRLTLVHAPLPWPGGVEIRTRDIDQLYVAESYANRRTVWHVLALCDDGVARRVTPGLHDCGTGRWIERVLEEHLDIEDRAVANEA